MADPKSATDSKERFSNRVEDYVRYRPGYPREILDVLREGCGLTAESVVVDVGSGTGLLAQLFLENGNIVYGVEPNAAMRDAGEQFLEKYRHFCSVAGSAEATTLPDACADFVVAGQAFHWFEPKAARAVGAAVGRNPISFVVPCHRVLGRSGALTGYHWGLARKQAIIGWEAGRVGAG